MWSRSTTLYSEQRRELPTMNQIILNPVSRPASSSSSTCVCLGYEPKRPRSLSRRKTSGSKGNASLAAAPPGTALLFVAPGARERKPTAWTLLAIAAVAFPARCKSLLLKQLIVCLAENRGGSATLQGERRTQKIFHRFRPCWSISVRCPTLHCHTWIFLIYLQELINNHE